MIYLDSAALFKLIHTEVESPTLGRWLRHAEGPLFTSVLAEVELARAARAHAPAALPRIPRLLSGVHLVELTAEVRTTAGSYAVAGLRSLDAIHLATASVISRRTRLALKAFLTYDKQLFGAALSLQMPALAPSP